MGNEIRQCVALNCFSNLVQFVTIQKFNTDCKSVAWRKLFVNICLGGIEELDVKKSDLASAFNLQYRTVKEYMTGLAVHDIKFPEPPVKQGPSWEKREGGNELINLCKGYWGAHLTTSPKENDIVFKHVRGAGLHTLVEINGFKEFQCNPGRFIYSKHTYVSNAYTHAPLVHFFCNVIAQNLGARPTKELSEHTQLLFS